MLIKLRARLQQCGDTSSEIFECKCQVLSLELIQDTMQDCMLEDVLEVNMKLQSLLDG